MSVSSKNGGHSPQDRGRSSSPFAVVASARFESGPPVSKMKPSDEEGDVVETVKEEEWEERRKKTTTTTRNVERRVQRQLVLEDGEVIGDSGPVVTEDATEDTVTREVVSDQNQRPEGQLALEPTPGDGWVATPGALVISEKCTKTVKSHDEVEDELETEEIQHCGDVTNQEAEDHVKGQSDLRELIAHRQNQGWELTKPQKKVVHEATRRRGNIDTVDVHETSKVQDGHVVTETERTVRQEQYDNESVPDSGSSLSDGSVHETTKETSHNLVHTKDEDLLEYYAVPKGGTLAQGVKLGEGMHVVSEDVHEDRQGNEDDSALDRLKKVRTKPVGRRDVLTKRPVDYEQEEETRKSETSKWLEHHFGSESGRSEDSAHDTEDSPDKIHSSGGNRITITMSPRPATNEDVTDSSISPVRRWPKESAQGAATPKAPPPPPPKPERIWSTTVEPPKSPMSQTFSRHVHDIQGSELAAARSRLRSTGLTLTEENKENNAPDLAVKNIRSSNRFQMADPTKHTNSQPVSSCNKTSSLKEDVIYSSRFRSGKPKGKAPLAPDSLPSQLPVTPPPSITNVGRSQSFHVQTLPWSSKKESISPYKSSMKDYRSEERLDDIDTRKTYYHHRQSYDTRTDNRPSADYKPFYTEKRSSRQTKCTWSPPREPTPPPPPRQSRRSPIHKNHSNIIGSGKEVATQTGTSPVPPPRTKRKKRPKSSYFFGDNGSSPYSSVTIKHNGSTIRHSAHEMPYSDNNYHNESKHYSDRAFSSKRSPKVEKRYKTTKTITPVIVVPYEDRSEKYKTTEHSSHSANKSSWMNTVDPRRRPRISPEEERSTTLPRKHSNNTISFPKKTYLFGETDPSNELQCNNRNSNTHKGSMHNISVSQLESQTDSSRITSLNNRLNNQTGKPVGRSQSFNVQPGKNYPNTITNGRPLSEISDQKTSTVYGSSPYVNLRSPNLIATIARTSSTRRSDSNESNDDYPNKQEDTDDKREVFMKGLLNTAPELFHFIHGNEDDDSGSKSNQRQRRNSPPIHTKPTVDVSSPYFPPTSKSPTYSARVFTFGKSDNNTLTRTSSQGLSGTSSELRTTLEDENKRNLYKSYSAADSSSHDVSMTTAENNKRNSIISNTNRKSTFNLKTSGSSLLYSPSFRSQQQQEAEERRKSRGSSVGKERLSGDFSKPNLSSGMQGESPVLVQVRDWNMR